MSASDAYSKHQDTNYRCLVAHEDGHECIRCSCGEWIDPKDWATHQAGANAAERASGATGQPPLSQSLSVGDTVQLNSGGPSMTVLMVDRRRALCRWFRAGGDTEQDWFDLRTIKARAYTAEKS